jgi:hypothetical protein
MFSICSFSGLAAHPLDAKNTELPVEPKKKKQGRKRLWGTEKQKELPKTRKWGVFSAVLGGYLIIFSITAVLFLIGFNWYIVVLLGLLLIPGLMLMIMGIKWIDQSYFHYSENPALLKERLRPLIWRDFIFAFILALIMVPMIIIEFYATASLILLALLALLMMAFLKLGEYRRL